MNTVNTKVEVFLTDFDNGQIGYDIAIKDDQTTISDYLEALIAFAEKYLADCKGCDGCCHERIPLTILDIDNLGTLLDHTLYPTYQVIKNFALVELLSDGAIDITLKRNKDGECYFLDKTAKICTRHTARPFVCRSHFCLHKSPEVQKLRSIITNYGMDALIVLLLKEEKQGAPLLLPPLDPLDYAITPLINKRTYQEVIIKDIIPPELWQIINKAQS
ncbi:MAG: YkgJ family cysteine cluster protein [Bacillota bacterium]|jgi:Fe-S-cluster containining protein